MVYLKDLNLSDEVIEKIESRVKESYVLKKSMDKLVVEKSELQALYDNLQEKYEAVSKNTKKMDDLSKNYEKLKSDYDTLTENHAKEIQSVKIDYAVNDRLKSSGVRNIKVVKPLLNYEQIKFNEKNELDGLEQQIEALKKSEETNFLFLSEDREGMTPNPSKSNNNQPAHDRNPIYDQLNSLFSTYAPSK